MKRPLYVAKVSRLWYLPNRYKDRTRTVVHGVAASGEVAPEGLVAETEDWEGRQSATALPSTIRYRYDPSTGRVRPMTMKELIDKGLFVVGSGPTGIRRQEAGVHGLET